MSKGKNKNKNRRLTNQPVANLQPALNTEVTADTLITIRTEAEFEKNKGALIAKFNEDIEQLEEKKKAAEESLARLNNLAIEKQRAYNDIKVQYDEAVKTIESAENRAEEIRDSAEKERAETLLKASEKAQEAFKAQAESFERQLEDIAAREKTLSDSRLKFNKERQDFDILKEEFDECNAHIQKLKDRYMAACPEKIEMLELELKDAQGKYMTLVENRDALAKKYYDAQVLLDAVKTEVEDANGDKKLISLQQIITSLHELKETNKKLAAVLSSYPDYDSITTLEEQAHKAERLERENFALELERNRYREEAAAARNANKELEVVRQEVEATNALNEHLLQELESHKTALESRTGDTCPSLSKVDVEVEEQSFKDDIVERMRRPQMQSLKDIVLHVKNYAGSRKKEEQLFYAENDIRAFLAGMAVSRLIILQGMSGTGKSSLPRIFSEAVSGFNCLIPVESSWRDRNELLGYYNDFNKKFNAKSFTVELYRRAKKRCQEIPTFIVLDEMNLARIEYYFSDFLAILQEPNHDKWKIELVSSDMRTLPMKLSDDVKQKIKKDTPNIFEIWEKIERSRQGDLKAETSDEEKALLTSYLAKLNSLTGAKDLEDGRKIKVTDNMWFIGTANKDESTFEISDKVYDRAQIVPLNKRGVSEGSYKATEKKYISVTDLKDMFANAIACFKAKADVERRLNELDKFLIEKFDISFGNRIVTQTIDFAAVFTAAGGQLTDAIDYQISTKILRKIINSDDAEAFIELSDVTKDYHETQRLINKRLNDLK